MSKLSKIGVLFIILIITSCGKPSSLEKSSLNEANSSSFKPEGILLIVHASNYYDYHRVSQSGISQLVALWEKAKLPIYHLEDPRFEANSNFISKAAHHFVEESYNGEHDIVPIGNSVTVVGGYYHDCLTHALAHLMLNWKKNNKEGSQLTFNLYTPGIYVRKNHSNGTYGRVPGVDYSQRGELTLERLLPTAIANEDIWSMFYGHSYEYGVEDEEENGVLRGFYEEHLDTFVSTKNHNLIIRTPTSLLATFGNPNKPKVVLNLFNKF